jgi:hypothetical protein
LDLEMKTARKVNCGLFDLLCNQYPNGTKAVEALASLAMLRCPVVALQIAEDNESSELGGEHGSLQ